MAAPAWAHLLLSRCCTDPADPSTWLETLFQPLSKKFRTLHVCTKETSALAQSITVGIKHLLEEARKEVTTLPLDEAVRLSDRDDHVFVDLRDIREINRTGKVPGAFSCPRGMLEFWIDPESPYHKEIFNQDKTYVFYCASGWRSALSAKTAMTMGLSPVAHVDGGFTAWIAANGPIETID